MPYFAQVINGIVQNVIVAEQDFINEGSLGTPSEWIQTYKNLEEGGQPTNIPRKNMAEIGYIYDEIRDAFYEPQPYPSWLFNETECVWYCAVDYPWEDEGTYEWNEELLEWVII